MELSVGDLESLFVDSADFEALSAAFDVFCPFEAIGMVDQEIRHASYLNYIFDPAKPHGFGSLCVEAFLRIATRRATSPSYSSGACLASRPGLGRAGSLRAFRRG
jgi:hypothetical protein